MGLIKLIHLKERNSEDLFLELNNKLADVSKHLLFSNGYYKFENKEDEDKNILLKISEMFSISVQLLFSTINNQKTEKIEKLVLKAISTETNVKVKTFEELIEHYTFNYSYHNMILLNINRYIGDIAQLLQKQKGYVDGPFLENEFILKIGMLMLYIIALYNILLVEDIDPKTRIETFTNLLE